MLMAMRGAPHKAGLREEVQKKLQSFMSKYRELSLQTDGEPSMERGNSAVSSLVTEDMKNKWNCYFRTSYSLTRQDHLCEKFPKVPNTCTVV